MPVHRLLTHPLLFTLLALLSLSAAATAQGPPARPVYQPPLEDLPVPEELPAPAAEGPLEEERVLEVAPEFLAETPALLGVHVVPLTADLLRFYGPELRNGVVIESIGQGTPADRFRLPIGGAIVAVDNIRITEPADLAAVIGMYAPGDTVSIIYHDGRQFAERRVTLAPRLELAVGPVPPPVRASRGDPPLVLTPSENSESELLPTLPPAVRQENPAEELVLSDDEFALVLRHIQDLRQRSAEIEAEIESLEGLLESQER